MNNRSYQQAYPQYNQPGPNPYENQRPPWNNVDCTPATASFQDYSQFPREPGSYDNASLLPSSNEQSTASPNYSQYLNFDSMDTSSIAAGPSGSSISSQSPYNTGCVPVSAIPPQQYTSTTLSIKPEPDGEQLGLPFSNLPMSMSPMDATFPQTCGAMPTCLQMLDTPEIEDFNMSGMWMPSVNTISQPESEAFRRPSHTATNAAKSSSTMSRKPSSCGDGSDNDAPKKPRKRGRKPSTIIPAEDEGEEEAAARAKQAHSIVERRYRDNLNGKIMQLHRTLAAIASDPARPGSISALMGQSDVPLQSHDPRTGSAAGTRVRKSDVMTDAVNYVHQSEVSMRHMADEIQRLTERVLALEKLVRCEDCVLLKNMVRRSLNQGQQRQGQIGRAGQ